MENNKPLVAVAMSGGVDSSVAAALLVREGYPVIGLHLSFWKDPTQFSDEELREFPQNRCCSAASLEDARRVAASIGIPFYVLNFRERFKEKVVDYFVSGYEQGETPNPCVTCNREMKFGALLERARQLGAEYLATGHYARVERHGDETKLYRATDTAKDQSYFLYHLSQDTLRSLMFPIGAFRKEEVYAKAQEWQLPIPEKKESQGICFIPDKKNVSFLRRHASEAMRTPGPIRDVNGTVYTQQHRGLALYTIGQREGISVGGVSEPLYVTGFDVPHNTLIVGRKEDIYKNSLTVHSLCFTTTRIASGNQGELTVTAAIRYRFAPQKARVLLSRIADNSLTADVIFDEPVRAVAPGQSVVFYQNDEVLGGGIIGQSSVPVPDQRR